MLSCPRTGTPELVLLKSRTDQALLSKCIVCQHPRHSSVINPVTRPRSYLQVRCETLKSEAKQQKKPSGPWKGIKAYSTLLKHARTLGPLVLLKILIVGIRALGQGIHAAGAEALKVAVGSGKAKQTANLAAEIVRLGWTSFACHVVIAALRRGYLESALRLCAVLIQQQDTDVLLETTQGMTEVGGSKEAEELKQALTGRGYQLGWLFGKLANQRTPQNREEAVQAAKDTVSSTAGAIKGAVAGAAESMAPKPRYLVDLEEGGSRA